MQKVPVLAQVGKHFQLETKLVAREETIIIVEDCIAAVCAGVSFCTVHSHLRYLNLPATANYNLTFPGTSRDVEDDQIRSMNS